MKLYRYIFITFFLRITYCWSLTYKFKDSSVYLIWNNCFTFEDLEVCHTKALHLYNSPKNQGDSWFWIWVGEPIHKLRLHFLAFYHVPTPLSLQFLCSKCSIFLTTYPPLNANVICEGSLSTALKNPLLDFKKCF